MGKFIDLTGQKFNEVIVLEKDQQLSIEKHKTYWKCQCSCGNIFSVRADNLKKIQTCGKCKYDLTNKRFDRLLVLKKGKIDKNGHQYYICQCDCGTIVEVNSDSLRRGLTRSCGCWHKERMHEKMFIDHTGEKYNMLTLLDYFSNNGKIYYHCKCDCGNECIVESKNILNNHTKSCGCLVSYGEKRICELLKEANIIYEQQKQFSSCVNPITNKKLRFDFFVNNQYIIEYDGRQHLFFTDEDWNTQEQFENTQYRDNIKNKWCKENKIPIIRIPAINPNLLTINDLLLETSSYILKWEADSNETE